MRAAQISRFGATDVFQLVDLPKPVPQPGQVLVKVRVSGINFSDTLMRENRYAMTPELPCVLGSEVSGVVEDANGCAGWTRGQRVVVPLFASGNPYGGYAEYVVADASAIMPIPDEIADDVACALLVQGLTALALARHVNVSGKTVLVSAAAGGVGSLLLQFLKHAGARRVIGAASSPEKRSLAKTLGADAVVDYTAGEWLEQVREFSDGLGPDIIYESVGGSITEDSLTVLASRGSLIIYGALNIQSFALGVPELLPLIFKNQSITGFAFAPLLTPEILRADLLHLYSLVQAGQLTVQIGGCFALDQVALAHAALASRSTMGKLVLQVG